MASKDAREIAAIPGVTAVFAASGDLGNFSGYKQGTPDYERLINILKVDRCRGTSVGRLGSVEKSVVVRKRFPQGLKPR